jgi:Predicted metal-dependent membrane protease
MRDEFPKNQANMTESSADVPGRNPAGSAQGDAARPSAYAAQPPSAPQGQYAGAYYPAPVYYYPPPNPHEIRKNAKKSIRRNANQIALALLSVFVFSAIFAQLFWGVLHALPSAMLSLQTQEIIYQLVELLLRVFSFLLPAVLLLNASQIPRRWAFPARRPKAFLLFCAVGCCLGVSLLGGILVQIVSVVTQALLGVTPVAAEAAMPVGIPETIIFALNIALVAPLVEEILFRGVIMQSLRPFGDGFALVASSILFGLAHGNLVQTPNALVMGLVIGYFVLRTNSLWTGIVLHMVNNAISVGLQLATRYTTTQQDMVINNAVFLFFAASGIIGFILLRIRYGPVFCLKKEPYPLGAAEKQVAFFTAPAAVLYVLLAAMAAGNLL